MQIDWFTFSAQIVNFLLLVWLLKRFLYAPIVNAMAEREERIADRFEEAREKREAAEAEAATYREKQEEFASVREEKLAEAEEAAEERRREMVEDARTEVARLEKQWKDALRREREAFLKGLAERASRKTMDIARRALHDLAHAELERQVVRVFIDRLSSLDDERRQVLADAVRSDDGDVAIHTAFELDDDHRQNLLETLQAVTGTEVVPDFDRKADVGFGVEVRAGGHKVAWSLESYFDELEDHIRARIDTEISSGAASSNDHPDGVLEGAPSEGAGTDEK